MILESVGEARELLERAGEIQGRLSSLPLRERLGALEEAGRDL